MRQGPSSRSWINHSAGRAAVSERTKLLREIMRLDFAVQDSALFLDLRPHDECALQYFREHLELLISAKEEYECRFGPLSNRSAEAEDYARYALSPFPWTKEEC